MLRVVVECCAVLICLLNPPAIHALEEGRPQSEHGLIVARGFVSPGMLYDAKRDMVQSHNILWSKMVMHNRTTESQYSQWTDKVDFDDRATLLGIKARVKVSFMAGMITLEGSAAYLHDEKESTEKSTLVNYHQFRYRT